MKMAFTQKQRMIEGLTIFTLIAISIYVAVMWENSTRSSDIFWNYRPNRWYGGKSDTSTPGN